MPRKNKDTFDLREDGFCFLPSLFSQSEVESAYQGLWEIINGKYRTGIRPENRFWNLGDDPKSIIRIDKPHLCNKSVWSLVTKPKLGEALALKTNAETIHVWHSQVVWKPQSYKNSGNAGWHRDAQ